MPHSAVIDPARPVPRAPAAPLGAGRWLTLWVALALTAQAVAWLIGVRPSELAAAVEQGASRVESRGIGELSDHVIRKAIRTQEATRTFWTALAALGDFGLEPLALVVRAALVATLCAGLAALAGRPPRFQEGLAACAALQGVWVLGLVLRVVLMAVLKRVEVETGATLLLPPGRYPAAAWVALSQLDAFHLTGYAALAWTGWRRGQLHLLTAVLVCGGAWFAEAILRTGALLLLGAGMRLTLIPET